MDIIKNRKPSQVQLGDWTVWSLSDGHFDLDQRLLFGKDPEVLRQAFLGSGLELSEDCLACLQVNAYLIDTKEHLILVDTGCGSSMGSSTGFLCNQILEAGFSPDDISHVLITHLHGDHMGGLVDGEGGRIFPNAFLYVSAVDAAFWRDSKQKPRVAEFLHYTFDLAKKMLAPYEQHEKLRLIQPGETILTGIEAVDAAGHTLGHMAYRFYSKGDTLILWGDLVHVIALQLENLDWEVVVDIDPKQGAMNRKNLIKEACQQRMLIGGGHLSGSGLGYISQEGDRFAWKPYVEL